MPEILERGLRELNAEAQSGFEGAAEVLEIWAGLPTPRGNSQTSPIETLRATDRRVAEKKPFREIRYSRTRRVAELRIPGAFSEDCESKSALEADP
ncbi:MAG TPA: hypothetical protein VGK64_09730 [Bryobacteraceae bacterium]